MYHLPLMLRRVVLGLSALYLSAQTLAAPTVAADFDLIVRGGMIYDGSPYDDPYAIAEPPCRTWRAFTLWLLLKFLASLPVHRWLERLGLLEMSGQVVAGRLHMLTHFVTAGFAKHL